MGIRTFPPLFYCSVHECWEGWDELEQGVCAWCCAEEPCPYGHSKEWEERVEPPTVRLPKNGRAGDGDGEMDIPYLDWS